MTPEQVETARKLLKDLARNKEHAAAFRAWGDPSTNLFDLVASVQDNCIPPGPVAFKIIQAARGLMLEHLEVTKRDAERQLLSLGVELPD